MATEQVPTVRAASGPLREVAALFLKLGVIGFGGPTAHIAMMEEEVVRRRRWLSREHFLDALAVTNMVPGPNSTEMAIHLGYLRAGVLGGVVAGLCFIGPAFLLMLVLSWAYVQYGTLPAVGALFWGVKPVVVAIIIAAAYRLARNALTSPWLIALAALAGLGAALQPGSEVWLLLGAGLLGYLLTGWRPGLRLAVPLAAPLALAVAAPSPLLALAWVCFKTGAFLFGGGYVMIPLMEPEVVNTYGWLTHQQFLDGIALGQSTPGPIVITATFVGYLTAGLAGAVVATVAIFLPAFVIVLAGTGPFTRRLRHWQPAQRFLKGVNAAVVGTIVAASLPLARAALVDPLSVILGLGALVALVRFRVDTLPLIVGGAALGLLALLVPGLR